MTQIDIRELCKHGHVILEIRNPRTSDAPEMDLDYVLSCAPDKNEEISFRSGKKGNTRTYGKTWRCWGIDDVVENMIETPWIGEGV